MKNELSDIDFYDNYKKWQQGVEFKAIICTRRHLSFRWRRKKISPMELQVKRNFWLIMIKPVLKGKS